MSYIINIILWPKALGERALILKHTITFLGFLIKFFHVADLIIILSATLLSLLKILDPRIPKKSWEES